MEARQSNHLKAQEPYELVIRAMTELDIVDAKPRGQPAYAEANKPGNNDPHYRTSAFAFGVSLAVQPIVDAYKEADARSIHDIFNRTFRLSFQYSAGSPLLQSLFQLRISQLLCDKYGERVLGKAAESAPFEPSKFGLPANHSGGRSIRRATERLPAIWNFYMDIAKNVENPTELKPLDKMHEPEIDLLSTFGSRDFIPLGIPYFMLSREVAYLKDGRPNKKTHQKKYRSDIREHSVEGKPTGNPEFNVIFSEMGVVLNAMRKLESHQVPDFYLMTTIKRRISELERLWQERHDIPFKSVKG